MKNKKCRIFEYQVLVVSDFLELSRGVGGHHQASFVVWKLFLESFQHFMKENCEIIENQAHQHKIRVLSLMVSTESLKRSPPSCFAALCCPACGFTCLGTGKKLFGNYSGLQTWKLLVVQNWFLCV